MKRPGEASDDLERRLEAALPSCAALPPESTRYEAATVAVASPVRRAVDWAGFRLEGGAAPVWAKVLQPDMAESLSFDLALAAGRQAGEAGLAPKVLGADAATGVIFYEALDAPWTWARIKDLIAPARLEALLALKKRVHATAPLAHDRDVFDEVSELLRRCRHHGVALPEDVAWMEENLRHAALALQAAGRDSRPGHGDGAASNVMCGPQGALRLVDFDAAGNMDPLFDLATTLVEVCEFDDEWERGVEIFVGRPDRQVLARCRLYAIADDLRWGLWGLLAGACSPRKDVEFFKYGQWRLLRGRGSLHDHRFELWLRQV